MKAKMEPFWDAIYQELFPTRQEGDVLMREITHVKAA
jgi:hypothetical protein